MTIDLPLPETYREVIANMDADAIAHLTEKVREELNKLQLLQTLNNISDYAESQGMTPELAEEIMKEIS